MNEIETTQESAKPMGYHRPRAYAPWMIGVLIVFGMCECLFLTWGYGGIGCFVIGLIFAILFNAMRCCRVYEWTCLGWLISVLISVLMVILMLMILLPAISTSREAVRRMNCASNLKQLGLAVLNYQETHGQFPPAFVADGDGKPMHSWRTLILPHIEEQDIYDAYDFQKPWDSPENQKLAAKSKPHVFQCPSVSALPSLPENRTDYVAVLGADTFWRADGTPRTVDEIKAGTHNTAILIEINRSDIPWHEPRDVNLADLLSGKLSWDEGSVHTMLSSLDEPLPWRHVLFADGTVYSTQGHMTPDQLRRMFSITELFDVETELPHDEPRPIVHRHVLLYVWEVTLAMQFFYIFFPVKRSRETNENSRSQETNEDSWWFF